MSVRRFLPAAILAASSLVALKIALPPVYATVPNNCQTCQDDGCSATLQPGETIQPVANSTEYVEKCLDPDGDKKGHCCTVESKAYYILDSNHAQIGYCYKHYCAGGVSHAPYLTCLLQGQGD